MTTGIFKPTKTKKTEKSYIARGKGFILSFLKKRPEYNVRLIDSKEFGLWMIDMKPKILPATWRQYRSAALFYSKKSRMLDHEILQQVLNSEEEKFKSCSNIKAYTRAKSINIDDLLAVNKYFLTPGKRNHKSFVATYNFFMASEVMGARPCEWKHAKIEYHAQFVMVNLINAKHTNGRAFGITRTLQLDNSCKEEMFFINETIRFIAEIRQNCCSNEEFEEKYETRISTMQSQFRAMNKAVFPKRVKKIQLYTARHQSAANFKSMGYSCAEIAALMGHASIDTAAAHYGKRKNGRGKKSPKVTPDPGNVARVVAMNEGRAPSRYTPSTTPLDIVSAGVSSDVTASASGNGSQVEAQPVFSPEKLALFEQSYVENTKRPNGGLTMG